MAKRIKLEESLTAEGKKLQKQLLMKLGQPPWENCSGL